MPKHGDDTRLHKSHGAKQIEGCCAELAPDFNIASLEMSWSADMSPRPDRHILTIRTDAGLIEIRFTEKEIKDFGGDKTGKNLRAWITAELRAQQRDLKG